VRLDRGVGTGHDVPCPSTVDLSSVDLPPGQEARTSLGADSGQRERRDRRIVITAIGHADRSDVNDVNYSCRWPGCLSPRGCRHRRRWAPRSPTSPSTRDPPGGAETGLSLATCRGHRRHQLANEGRQGPGWSFIPPVEAESLDVGAWLPSSGLRW